MSPKPKPAKPATVKVESLEHMRHHLEVGVDIRSWDNESLTMLIRQHIQLQEGHEAILALPDHLMRKPAKEAALIALGRKQ